MRRSLLPSAVLGTAAATACMLVALGPGAVRAAGQASGAAGTTQASPVKKERIRDRSRPRYFGHYTGQATVTSSAYHAPGVYDVDVAVAETESGVVGYLNIVFDASDWLYGTVTHTFSARPGDGRLVFKYSDRMCPGVHPPDQCRPAYTDEGYVQYSFGGEALFDDGLLTLEQPALLPDLPYEAVFPFDRIVALRAPGPPRNSFEGYYRNLELIPMGILIFPLPLPLILDNQVTIQDGEIVEWIDTSGQPFPLEWIFDWCFDDERGRGWMNQQGWWYYDWVLAPDGGGLNVIVTFSDFDHMPDCARLGDILAGEGLDYVHLNLAAIMFEL